MVPFKRYALACCVLAYMGGIVVLHLTGLFPRPDLYDLTRLVGSSLTTLEGRVLEGPVIRWHQTRFLIQGKASPLNSFHGKALVTLAYPHDDLAPGDHVRLRGWLSAPRRPRREGQFNERDY